MDGGGQKETLAQALRGQASIWRTPGLLPILALHGVGDAAAATVVGLWAGAYLADVHGLDSVSRGWILLAMGLALPSGLLVVGPLERRLNTRKWVAAPAAGCSICSCLRWRVFRTRGLPLPLSSWSSCACRPATRSCWSRTAGPCSPTASWAGERRP